MDDLTAFLLEIYLVVMLVGCWDYYLDILMDSWKVFLKESQLAKMMDFWLVYVKVERKVFWLDKTMDLLLDLLLGLS